MKIRNINTELIAKFKEYLILEEKSDATIEKYVRDVTAFAEFLSNKEISKDAVIKYKGKLLEQYKVRTINSVLASLNCFLNYLGLYDLKVKSVKLQKEIYCSEEKELSKAEYERLCKAAQKNKNERLNLVLQTICCTGIRVSELQFITVEAVKNGTAIVQCKNKTRRVFIVRKLQQKLLAYAKRHNIKSGMIFITRTGKALNRTNIWREMKGLCEKAGVNPKRYFRIICAIFLPGYFTA